MKVCLINCYINHHQMAFSQAMEALTGGDFQYISTRPISQARLNLGYEDLDHSCSFVIPAYDSQDKKQQAMDLAFDSDLVILGSAPDEYLLRRMKAGKITFKYSERPCKQKQTPYLWLRRIIAAWVRHGRFQKYPLYMLCASAYTAGDYRKYGDYLGRTYKWGYFPAVKQEDPDALFAVRRAAACTHLLWAGRFLNWKHPEAAVHAAAWLRQQGYHFQLDLIGNGPMEEAVRALISENHLEDCVSLLGSMTPDQVRSHMELADIYLFTSDFNEGWGAVLNESMNSCCAVVASHAIGAAPFLLRSGENGIIYENGNQQQFNEAVAFLLDHPEKRESYGRKAYDTLQQKWNAEVAAKRVAELYHHLYQGKQGSPFADGPCSIAQPMTNEEAVRLADSSLWKN